MKRLMSGMSLLLVLCVILSMAACTSATQTNEPASSAAVQQPESKATEKAEAPAQNEQTYEWAFGMAGTEETLNYIGAAKFKELVEAQSGGRIKVTLYPNSQLGSTAEHMEGHIKGTIPLMTGVTSMLPSYDPVYGIFDMPSTFGDIKTMRAFLSGDFRDILNEKYKKSSGWVMLGWCDAGFRNLTANKEVHTVSDIKGLKIRTQDNQYHLAYWNALGANAIAMDYTELYTNLQQGVIDAEENPYMNFYDSKLYEVQKYYIETRHVGHIMTFSLSTVVYDSLSDDLRKIVDDSMKGAMEYIEGLADESIEDYKQKCEEKGVTIITLAPEVLAEMQEKSEPVYNMVRKVVGDEIVDQFFAKIAEVR